MKKIAFLTLSLMMSLLAMAQTTDSPLRIGVSGVAHGHLWNLINAMNRGDFAAAGLPDADAPGPLRHPEGLRAPGHRLPGAAGNAAVRAPTSSKSPRMGK